MMQPVIFLNHGGGPLPLLGKQPGIANFLSSYLSTLSTPPPSSIIICSAHYESASPSSVLINSNPNPNINFDYGGFPDEAYEYTYNVPGHPELARALAAKINSGTATNVTASLDPTGSWDHGVFVPLMLLSPSSLKIPVVSVSVIHGYSAASHIALGAAIADSRSVAGDNALIVGSGSSFHSMRHFFAPNGPERTRGLEGAAKFDNWLQSILCEDACTREELLEDWRSADNANEIAHPDGEGEHLVPLMFCAGAGAGAKARAIKYEKTSPFDEFEMTAFEWT